jgi:hypothetical protein
MNAEYIHVERRILTTNVDEEEPASIRKQKDEIEEKPHNTNDKVGKEGCCSCVVF